MKILDEVKKIVEDNLGLPFLYQSFYKLNAWLDFATFPCVACQLVQNGSLENEGGSIKDSADLLIMFIDKTEFDECAFENMAIIDDCKENAIKFIRYIEKSSEIMYAGMPRYDNLFDKFDVNVTGVALRITLKERAGTQYCLQIIDEDVS